ncbi:hypothetical protein F383_33780 [Gossypium arboreum]|uniref:Uncharacterized protein n=1 Tax=Gossypium arboreum TaxID=29729 RepID=A0A0B0MA66_GOSAR|nr:hypothetical protein F383_38236 [Gossypium arboreum]KHG26331.1 hypothetical protein F383_33780 [Gossypium arboreum]
MIIFLLLSCIFYRLLALMLDFWLSKKSCYHFFIARKFFWGKNRLPGIF